MTIIVMNWSSIDITNEINKINVLRDIIKKCFEQYKLLYREIKSIIKRKTNSFGVVEF